MNNDKIYGLTAPFFGLCSLSPLGERIRLEEPVPCGEAPAFGPPVPRPLSRAVELGIERISLESEGLWRDPEPCLSLADYNCGPLPG